MNLVSILDIATPFELVIGAAPATTYDSEFEFTPVAVPMHFTPAANRMHFTPVAEPLHFTPEAD